MMEISEGGENWELGSGHVTIGLGWGVKKRLDPPQTLVLLGPAQGKGSQTKLTSGEGSSSWDWAGGGAGVVHCFYHSLRANTAPPHRPLSSPSSPQDLVTYKDCKCVLPHI